ncbi:uncharacterized protein LOC128865531 isoform X2 [Anastrepha ludens]|uniref:uncharacterized protein LOC128865531 isoform X2 n=1 Tax=Anastrepha ludens TaxID=28586 RepID=UPI0023B1BF89|nr:uncharacterized protein LOC128865531 isoform X2 [Anastrepha ludens]
MPETCCKFAKECRTQNSNEVSSNESAKSACSYKQRIALNRPKYAQTDEVTQLNSNDIQYATTPNATTKECSGGSKSRCCFLDSSDSVYEAKVTCCCPSHSEESNSCWKSKRRQIIRESSHAAGLDINARTTSEAAPTLATTPKRIAKVTSSHLPTYRGRNGSCGSHTLLTALQREAHQQCERVNRKISTSLPTTPNLSQLRRPKPIQYQKLALEAIDLDDAQQLQQLRQLQNQQSANSLQQLQMSATKLQNTARVTSRELSAQQQKQQQQQQQMIIPNVLPLVVGVDENGANKVRQVPATAATKQKIFPKTNNNSNNENRNERAAGEKLSTLMSRTLAAPTDLSTQPLIEQHTSDYNKNNQHDQNNGHAPLLSSLLPPPVPLPAPQSSSIATSTTTSATSANSTDSAHSAAVVGKNTLAFCEHCCESASMASGDYAQGAYAECKKYSSDEDHDRCYREFTDSVSDLSSYRFVSDEDEVSACIAVNETTASEEIFSQKTKHHNIKNKNKNNNNNNIDQDSILAKNQRLLSSQSHSRSSPPPPSPSAPPLLPSLSGQTNIPSPTLLLPAAVQTTKIATLRRASPTICCYTIDKPVSIHHNATVLEYVPSDTKRTSPTPTPGSASATAPVPIPTTNTIRSAYRLKPQASESSEFLYPESLLSISLPSNYGSVRGIESRHLQHTQWSPQNFKPPPPEPPPKPKQGGRRIYQSTIYSSSSASVLENQSRRAGNFHEPICGNDQNFQREAQNIEKSSESVSTPTQTSAFAPSGAGNCFPDEFRNSDEQYSRQLSRSLERSVSPEHCELLSCFGTVKNTRRESANITSNANQNDKFLGDVRGKENSRLDEDSAKRSEPEVEIENDKETKFVARSLSDSSCLVSAATTPIANEKCAIENKNNSHQHQLTQQPRQQLEEPLIQPPTPPSYNKNNYINNNNNNNNNNINNKQRYCGDSEQSQRSATNRKKSASTSVYAVATVSDGAFDIPDTHVELSGRNSACGECNNNYNCKARCRTVYSHTAPASSAHPCVTSAEPSCYSSQSSVAYLSSSLPKRTLRYDSYGRLKSERVSRLPTGTKSLANGRKAASETRLHRANHNAPSTSKYDLPPSLSANNIKLTPTLCRKFNYLSDKFEDCVVEREELELDTTAARSENNLQQKQQLIVQHRAKDLGDVEQISTEANSNTTDALHATSVRNTPSCLAFDKELNLNFTKTIPPDHQIYKSFSDTQNFVANHKPNKSNNINNIIAANQSKRFFSDFSLKSEFAESDSSLPCQCSSNQPTSPTDTTSPTSPASPISQLSPKSSGGLNQKNSQSLPSVPQSNGAQSPLWLSSETIGSLRQSEPKSGLDDLQSNCSDQTTIFHLDNECSLSATSLSPTSHTQRQSLAGYSAHALRSPVVLKRIPAIHSFGYIPPIQSSLQSSANVRENDEREINMEKRRNTLDRFQRLGFGRKSTPASSGASSESSGSSRNRKSNEKSERLRELTELLRGGNRSSPTPPPIPPPRKPRHGSHSATNSLERSDTQMHAPAVGTASAGTSSLDNTPLSFMSTRTDDILLMDQEEQTMSSANDSTKRDANDDEKGDCGRSNALSTSAKAEAATAAATLAPTTNLYDTLKPNTSLSNFESLMSMSRAKSKSPPPPRSSGVSVKSCSVNANSAQLANSTDIATKLTRPESRTVIGSYAQKGIPFRSASFSQIDISSGKYKKSSWSALRDRLWRDKVVGSVDSATSRKNRGNEEAVTVTVEEKVRSEPDWIYIPLKKKIEMSINLNYGQDMKNLENVSESPDTIPEEDIFNTDVEQTSSITEECKAAAFKPNLVIAHAKMESLTDTIQSENDYTIEAGEVAVAIEPVPAVVEAEAGAVEKAKVIEQPTILEPINAEGRETNVATVMEERIPLESPPDNFLQTATTCLIPVPVYECAAQDWRLENPPQEWVEVQPEEFGIIPETIEPLLSLSDCVNVKPVPKTAQEYRVENVPTISVSRSSEEADDKCILRRKDALDDEFCNPVERRQASIDTAELSKRYSHDDIDVGIEKRASLDAITTRHSADERKRIDKSKRRKGMYIDNAAWSESPDGDGHGRGLALDISLANFNAIKPDKSEECGIMYINSPPTDENRTPGSLCSPEINTPESDKPPVWTKADRLASFSLQSSEEKDDLQCGIDSVSDNENERGPMHGREHTSPSPVPGDYDFKRYSKRPLRGPYGQMLEKEMKKPNKMHFEEILEDLRESENSTQSRRSRIAYDDSSTITMSATRNIPHHSNSMRVRKSNTFLPVPAHTRAASTPSQIENTSKGAGVGSLEKMYAHEKRYQSTLDNSVTSDDKDYLDAGHHYQPHHHHHHHHQREAKRAASEAPAQKSHHNKRSQSMSGEKTASASAHVAHQAKRSLDATTTGGAKTKAVVPSQELLAELLKGSSEKLISEQRQQMAADTRTHVVQEILRNEQSYVESLQTIVTKYLKVLKSPEHAGMIDSRTVDEIFFMVPDILEIHEKFHAELKSRWDGWDANQKVGDVFLETFSKLEVLEVYTSFVNNCNRAKNAIRTTKHQRPSFAKFLEMTAREHKGKLTLDNLLIKPVQKFPNYEMLFQRLIKHTDCDHPDQKHLQDVLKLVHDILVHINCKEREILENGQREATLRELEGVIEGITDLITPDRQFLLFDLVSMPSGQGARKERGFFLFNDLLVLTSIKKRSGTIRKPNPSTCPGTVASTLDTNKYKFLTKISLDCLEIVKTKDENVKRIMLEIESLAEDCNKLQNIASITTSLKYPHQYLEDVIRELLRDVQRQLSERQTNDTQLNMLELLVNSPNGSQKLSIVFSKAEKRTQWEKTFNEAKQKLAATLERHPIPEFLMSIPIRKTRAGLQFTCAAATLSEKRDVWVCNSDGYVGQVCIMSLYPEPNVTSCNGVCNARILCVASVPAYNSNNRNSANSGAQLQQQSQPTHPRSASTTPQHSYTQQLREYRKSISPNFQPPLAIGTPEKKKTPSSTVAGAANSIGAGAATTTDNGNSEGTADNQLDLNLSSSDDETDTGIVNISSVGGGAASSNGSGVVERVPSPAPSTQTVASATLPGSSSSGTPSHHSHQDSNPDEGDGNLSTMWIGTEDGCIHVYNSTDNIRIKKNRIKIEHQSAVYSILYLDNRVFVSLANGDICVYLRDGAAWNTSSSHCLPIGTVSSPVTKLLNVHGRLWCSIQGIVKVLDMDTFLVVNQIQVSSDSKPVTNMTVSNNYVWISIQNSANIKCFHSMSNALIAEINLAPAVNKMLSNCDEIIRQHKAACLRVTSLLSCRDLIWIGTSAGVLLTIPGQGSEKDVQNVVPTGIPHGHTGHVRFLTFVETSGLTSEGSGSSTGSTGRDAETAVSSTDYRSQSTAKHAKPKAESSTILVISGGDGYEDFRNSGANSLSEIAGREDSTNHLLIWQI